ncbi:MAG: hypothetical protein ACFCU3_05415 [Verrucomicrobiales bacterium]
MATLRRRLGHLKDEGLELLEALACRALENFPAYYFFDRFNIRTIERFEQQGWFEVDRSRSEWVARLTQEGRRRFCGGSDPEELWNRPWDKKWRFVVFDLPRSQRKVRYQMRQWLSNNRFGCLQGSVWVSPHPVQEEVALKKLGVGVDGLLLLQAVPDGRVSPADVVGKAWNHSRLNEAYVEFMDSLKTLKSDGEGIRQAMIWWMEASHGDPFLPRELEPAKYKGHEAWKAHQTFLTGGRTAARLRK